MSLSFDDFQAIRMIMREELCEEVPRIIESTVPSMIQTLVPDIVRKIIGEEVPVIVLQIMHAEVPTIIRDEVKRQVGPLEGRLMAVENDVKEIYFMIDDLRQSLPIAQVQS